MPFKIERGAIGKEKRNIMQRTSAKALLTLFGSLAALMTCLVLSQPSLAGPAGSEKSSITNQLFRSVQANDFAGVQAAVREGANIQARDRWGMTAADIAVDRGYYRIAHFLTAARNLTPDQQAVSSGPLRNAKEASLSAATVRQTAPVANQTSRSAPSDSSTLDQDSVLAPWPEGEPHPFDPGAPAPGSRLRSGF